MKFVANYMVQTTFRVPRKVQAYLLSSFDNDKVIDNPEGVVGAWWVKWNTFHYVDQEKNIQSVEGDSGDDFKYPSSVEEEEDSEAGSDSEGEESEGEESE